MSMSFLEEMDSSWAKAVREGTKTLILSATIRTEAPEMLRAIIVADNAKHGANLVEHSFQLLKRMSLVCRRSASIGLDGREMIDRDAAVRGFLNDSALVLPSVATDLFSFVTRISNPVLEDLLEFKLHVVKDATRDVDFSFLKRVCMLAVQIQFLRGAYIKSQLTCDKTFWVDERYCRWLSATDVDFCKKSEHADRVALAESFLGQVRSHYSKMLNAMDAAKRAAALMFADTLTLKWVLSKKSKFDSLEQIGVGLHALIVKATIGKVVRCPWKVEAAPSETDNPSKKPAKNATAALPQFNSTGQISMSSVLQDRGFAKDVWIEVVVKPQGHTVLSKGQKWCITSLTDDVVSFERQDGWDALLCSVD